MYKVTKDSNILLCIVTKDSNKLTIKLLCDIVTKNIKGVII